MLDSYNWELPIWDAVERMGRHHPAWREWLSHPTYADWWKLVSIQNKCSLFTVPVFMIGGYYDLYVAGMSKNFVGISQNAGTAAARGGTRIVMGPWEHNLGNQGMVTRVAEVDFGSNLIFPMREGELRWFDFWLKGIENRMDHAAPIILFIMGENVWRGENEWPLARTEYVPYYLHSQGNANSLFGDGVLDPSPRLKIP